MTPYEVWTGNKPDLSHVRIFGSKAMPHILKEKRLKWDKKAKELVLVGYAENHHIGNILHNTVDISLECKASAGEQKMKKRIYLQMAQTSKVNMKIATVHMFQRKLGHFR